MQYKVSYDTNGYLILKSGDIHKWYMVNDSTFINAGSNEYFAFGKMKNGKYTRIFPGNLAVMPMERLPFIDSAGLNIIVLGICMTAFILTFTYWPSAYFIRRKYTLNPDKRSGLTASNKWTGWHVSFLVLIFFIGLISSLSKPWESAYGVPPALKVLLVIPLILCLFLLILLYMVFKLTIRKEINISGKIHFYTLTFSVILLVWQLNHWNLLRFNTE